MSKLGTSPRRGRGDTDRHLRVTAALDRHFEDLLRDVEAGENIDPLCRRYGFSKSALKRFVAADLDRRQRLDAAKAARAQRGRHPGTDFSEKDYKAALEIIATTTGRLKEALADASLPSQDAVRLRAKRDAAFADRLARAMEQHYEVCTLQHRRRFAASAWEKSVALAKAHRSVVDDANLPGRKAMRQRAWRDRKFRAVYRALSDVLTRQSIGPTDLELYRHRLLEHNLYSIAAASVPASFEDREDIISELVVEMLCSGDDRVGDIRAASRRARHGYTHMMTSLDDEIFDDDTTFSERLTADDMGAFL